MKLAVNSPLARFFIAGAVNSLFGWSVYAAAISGGVEIWLALIIANLAGIGFNFVSLGKYAFRDLSRRRLPSFIAVYVIIYILNYFGLKVIHIWIAGPIIGQLILTGPLAICSYLMFSRFVFVAPKSEVLEEANP